MLSDVPDASFSTEKAATRAFEPSGILEASLPEEGL